MDDPFVSCPYNIKHRVPRSRLQGHIVKCPDKKQDFEICPYNATHRMPAVQMTEHIKDCPSRAAMFPEVIPPKVVADLTTPKFFLQRSYIRETDPDHEIWDD